MTQSKRLRRATALLGSLIIASLIWPVAGNAVESTRTWTPEEVLTPYGDDNSTWGRKEYLIASAADSSSVAIWERKRETDKVIELSRRTPGGEWSPAVVVARVSKSAWLGDMVVHEAGNVTFTLSRVRTGPDTFGIFVYRVSAGNVVAPRHESPGTTLVGNAQGDVMAISVGTGQDTQYIYRQAGGQWTAPKQGPAPTGMFVFEPGGLSMDNDGEVMWIGAFYNKPDGERRDQVGLIKWNSDTQTWSKLIFLAGIDYGLESIDADVNERGDIVVGWTDAYDDQEGYRHEIVRTTFIGHNATAPRPVKTWADMDDCWMHARLIGVGVDAEGNATAAWTQCMVDGSDTPWLQSARRPYADGAWEPPVTVDENRGFDSQLQVNAHGTAMLLSRGDATTYELRAYRRPPNGNWSAPSDFTPPSAQLIGWRIVFTLAPNSDATVLYAYSREHPVYARTFE